MKSFFLLSLWEERETGNTAPCQQPAAWYHCLFHQIAKERKNPLQVQAEVLPLDTLDIMFHLCPAEPLPRLQQPSLGMGKATGDIPGTASALSFNCPACSCRETSSLLHCPQGTEKLHTRHCTLAFTCSLFICPSRCSPEMDAGFIREFQLRVWMEDVLKLCSSCWVWA